MSLKCTSIVTHVVINLSVYREIKYLSNIKNVISFYRIGFTN